MYRILVKENGADRVVNLTGSVIEIGRGSENQVVIQDPRSSRKHCRISLTPQGWVLEDLKSRNGTVLNGAGVERNFLKAGDEFRIGSTRFLFEEEGNGSPVPDKADRAVADRAENEEEPAEALPAFAKPSTPAPTPADFYLEGGEGHHLGKRIPIARLPFTIGRKAGNDFVIEDLRASSHHARIVERKGRYWVEDLKSTNGTFLNQKKVQAAPLSRGAFLRIGDSSFRVELPLGLEPAPEDEAAQGEKVGPPDAGAAVVAEDDFARFDAREFLRDADRGAAPLQVAVILIALGTILYFAIDVTRKMVHRPDPDPSPDGNSVANWSFELEREGVPLPGWAVVEGDVGTIAPAAEGAQAPGRRALHLNPGGEGLCRATLASDIPVDPAGEYRLAAQVMNRGAFAAGVSVSWLAESEGRRVEVGRDWGSAVPQGISSLSLERTVKPPRSAVFARIVPFVIAAGSARGGAAFDQIFFGASEGGEESGGEYGGGPGAGTTDGEGVADEESDTPHLPYEMDDGAPEGPLSPGGPPRGPPIRLRVVQSGALTDLQRGPRPLIGSLWAGLGPEADPLALGHRLLTTPRQANDREGVLLSAQVPDTANGRWFNLETRVNGQGGEIHCEFRFGPGALRSGEEEGREAGPPDRAAVYLEPGIVVKSITAFGGSLSAPATFPPERPPAGALDEVIFGDGAEQVAVLFQPPVTLRSAPHPDAAGRPLLVAEAALAPSDPAGTGSQAAGSTRTLALRISPYSRRENEAAAALLEQAGQLHREGKPAEARARLKDLRSRFPWRAPDLAQAEALEKGWNGEAERSLAEIRIGLEDLKLSPSPVIRDALLKRVEALLVRFQGAPVEPAIRSVGNEVRRAVPAVETRKDVTDPAVFLQKAGLHLKNGELGFADLCLRLAQEEQLDAEGERRAKHLKKMIEERRNQRAEEEVR